MTTVDFIAVLLGLSFVLFGYLIWFRWSRARAGLFYHPANDYVPLWHENEDAASSRVGLGVESFDWPGIDGFWDTALLELRVRSSLTGQWVDPCLELQVPGTTWCQFFERGVCGTRWLDMTPALKAGLKAGTKIKLKSRHVHWSKDETTLWFFRTRLPANPRLLVVAPHPDDAEIAAFGLYRKSDAWIVTVTAGGQSYHGTESTSEAVLAYARLRFWDSLTVSWIGDIPPYRCFNLGFEDGILPQLWRNHFSHTDQIARLTESNATLPNKMRTVELWKLRAQNISPGFKFDPNASYCWQTLIEDLTRVLLQVRPNVIAAPHPVLDGHLDHCAATLALCQAVRAARMTEGLFLLYTNHPRATERYPFGPRFGHASPPPNFDKTTAHDATGVFSLLLDSETQSLKVMALDAMHDLREPPMLDDHSFSSATRLLRSVIRGWLTGEGRNPNTYFRRATRPNEVFLTASFALAARLEERARQILS